MALGKDAPQGTQTAKFGTFSGVFVPNVLTILGVILFMRSGRVVGQAGVIQALIILVIANAITFLTSLSLSAIATNTKVGGGGAYFMISRSLGLEIGGSIGVPLFLAPPSRWPSTSSDSPNRSLRFSRTWTSASSLWERWRAFPPVLDQRRSGGESPEPDSGGARLSLLSFFLGFKPVNFTPENWKPNYQPGFDFWTVFAIFFPAVTGVMAGASMSGDLKDPSKSIPRGTLAAVAVTFAVYIGQILWLGKSASRADLLGDSLVMSKISLYSPLIYAGLWAATLSSAIASLLGAPRTMQALAMDGVFPRILGKKSGPKREPRLALMFSGLLAAVCILIGDLNLVAPIISMFFLATYGMVNLVAGIESWVSNPSYRPTFKVHWSLSIIGAIGCLCVMFLLNAWATLAATVFMSALYAVLTTRRYQTAFGDTWSGFWFSVVRFGLVRFQSSRQHIRNWRPVLLVLSGNPKVRGKLVEFATLFESKRGYLFLAQILTGEWSQVINRRKAALESIEEFIDQNQLSADAMVLTANNFEEGVSSLIQTCGVGPLLPNMVMVGWSEDAIKHSLFRRTIQRILELERSLLLFVEAEKEDQDLKPTIDVWWRARVNGTLMLTLAHLLQTNPEWKGCSIRLLLIVRTPEGVEDARKNLEAELKNARIEGEVVPIHATEAPFEVIARNPRTPESPFWDSTSKP